MVPEEALGLLSLPSLTCDCLPPASVTNQGLGIHAGFILPWAASSSSTAPANVAILNNDWFGGFSGW